MKLLFLDIDGVLNDKQPTGSGYPTIDRDKADRLNQILAAVPDLQLVISSAWRYLILRGSMYRDGFESLLCSHGVAARDRLHGWTGSDEAFRGAHWDDSLHLRAVQIRTYAKSYPIDSWLALDDLDLPLEQHELVRTDGEVGLTDADVDRVIEHFQEARVAS